MKKTYISPEITVEIWDCLLLQSASGVTGIMNDRLEIGYGGVDEDGSKDPSANHFSGWDDDDWDKL